LLALLSALAVSVQFGAVPLGWSAWLAPFASGDEAPLSGGAYVLWDLRLPRALLAAAVGASLGLAGALAQGLFRNPMADPTLLGVTSGAACAAALVLTVFASLHMAVPPAWRLWVLPASAFGGALAVCWGLDRLARWLTPGSVAGLLLTGLALQAITMAVVGLCTYLATDEQLRSLTFWTLGSLAGASWLVLGVMTAALAVVASRIASLARALNALALGEAAAGHVGIDVPKLRNRVVVAVALLSALAVAWCGVIGFIGLMGPHLVRTLVGSDQRRVLPMSMGTGALLLLVADSVARTVAIPAEIPVGIFTALIGAPVFLAMLRGAARDRGGSV
jgi:iron complex transport system permease protein